MTGNDVATPGGLPSGPPWPLDLLADLHAGALDQDVADELRPRVESDPDARATLAALDATRQDLAALPDLRIPDSVAARIDAAIVAEAAARAAGEPPATAAGGPFQARVVDLAAARRRRRGLIAGGGLLAAAAAVAVVAVVNLSSPTTSGVPNAGATSADTSAGTSGGPPTEPLAVSSRNLADALDEALGASDYGPLAGADRLEACLSANGAAGVEPVGAISVTLDGRPGVLVVLPAGGTSPRWRMLVVGPQCGPGNPATLADTTTG